jgi:hypothetical protein
LGFTLIDHQATVLKRAFDRKTYSYPVLNYNAIVTQKNKLSQTLARRVSGGAARETPNLGKIDVSPTNPPCPP